MSLIHRSFSSWSGTLVPQILLASRCQFPLHQQTPIAASHIDSATIKLHMIVFLLLGSRRRISCTHQMQLFGVYACNHESLAISGLKKQMQNRTRGIFGTGSAHASPRFGIPYGCRTVHHTSSRCSILRTSALLRTACRLTDMDADHIDRGIHVAFLIPMATRRMQSQYPLSHIGHVCGRLKVS